jgi:hypothetical protein
METIQPGYFHDTQGSVLGGTELSEKPRVAAVSDKPRGWKLSHTLCVVPTDFESDEVRKRFEASGAGYVVVLNEEISMDWIEVAQKAAQQPWWQWEEGMLYRAVSAQDPLGRVIDEFRIAQHYTEPIEHLRKTAYPVLTDYATIGIVLKQTIEAYQQDQLPRINNVLGYWAANWNADVPGLVLIELLTELNER